ncbi:MAG: DUF3053 family protein [Thermodesulfobacteriota bacterium]
MDKKNTLTRFSRIYLAVVTLLFGAFAYHQLEYQLGGDGKEAIVEVITAFVKFFFGSLIISSVLSFPFKSRRLPSILFNISLTILFCISCVGVVMEKTEIIEGIKTFHSEIAAFVGQEEEQASAPFLVSLTASNELFGKLGSLDVAELDAYAEKTSNYIDQAHSYEVYFEQAPEKVKVRVGDYSRTTPWRVRNAYLEQYQSAIDARDTAVHTLMALHQQRGQSMLEFIDFLRINQQDWQTDGTHIRFSTDEQVARYNQLIDGIAAIEDKINKEEPDLESNSS